MSLLAGKKALILGIANERSLAFGIAKAFKEQGAQLGITFLNEAMEKRVVPLAQELKADFICSMDVAKDEDYVQLQEQVQKNWGKFDILVHSLAFAPTEDLKKDFIQCSRQGFAVAMDISAYSLIALCEKLAPLMNAEGSVMSLTYHGSTKVVKNYNLMGVAKAALEATTRYLSCDLGKQAIRINCLSAGPVRTLAASGVPGFRDILSDVEAKAPLHRNITSEDVGGMAVYLASDLSRSVTGQVMYVDSGHSIMAL